MIRHRPSARLLAASRLRRVCVEHASVRRIDLDSPDIRRIHADGMPSSTSLCCGSSSCRRRTFADIAKRLLHPPLAALGEDGLEVAFEEGAGVLEVLFGVGFGGGDALKRFVEDADDPLLFGERGNGNGNALQACFVDSSDSCRRPHSPLIEILECSSR